MAQYLFQIRRLCIHGTYATIWKYRKYYSYSYNHVSYVWGLHEFSIKIWIKQDIVLSSIYWPTNMRKAAVIKYVWMK